MKKLFILLFILITCPAFAGTTIIKKKATSSPGAVGSSTRTQEGGEVCSATVGAYQDYPATATGNVNRICFYVESFTSGALYNVAIYNSDGSTRLGDGTLTTGFTNNAVNCISLDSPVAVTVATVYRLAVGSSDDSYWLLGTDNDVSGAPYVRSGVTFTTGDTMPSTMTGGTQVQYYKGIIYADYN